MGGKAKFLKEKIQARSQLAGAPLLVAQLGAMEFRNRMLRGEDAALHTLRLGTQSTVCELIKKFGKLAPLTLLKICYGHRSFDFAERLLQHAEDLDFVQDTLTATGVSPSINPIFNGVLAGFNRRRRHGRFKFGHYNLELDRLRYAFTATPRDSDLAAADVTKDNPKQSQSTSKKQYSARDPCWFFQRTAGCRRNPCPFTHKCMICNRPGHGAVDCQSRRNREDRRPETRETENSAHDRPPNPRSRRARAQ